MSLAQHHLALTPAEREKLLADRVMVVQPAFSSVKQESLLVARWAWLRDLQPGERRTLKIPDDVGRVYFQSGIYVGALAVDVHVSTKRAGDVIHITRES